MQGMRLSVVAGIVGAFLLSGCGLSPCSAGPQPSGRYRVTAHEPYDEGGQFTFSSTLSPQVAENRCAGPFGAGVGAQLEFRTTGRIENGNYCTVGSAELTATSSTDAELLGPSKDSFVLLQVRKDNAFFRAAEDAQIGTCRGAVGFEVLRGNAPDGLFSTPVPGQYPPVVLYRLFAGDATSTSCPMCDDAFVAEIEQLAE